MGRTVRSGLQSAARAWVADGEPGTPVTCWAMTGTAASRAATIAASLAVKTILRFIRFLLERYPGSRIPEHLAPGRLGTLLQRLDRRMQAPPRPSQRNVTLLTRAMNHHESGCQTAACATSGHNRRSSRQPNRMTRFFAPRSHLHNRGIPYAGLGDSPYELTAVRRRLPALAHHFAANCPSYSRLLMKWLASHHVVPGN